MNCDVCGRYLVVSHHPLLTLIEHAAPTNGAGGNACTHLVRKASNTPGRRARWSDARVAVCQ